LPYDVSIPKFPRFVKLLPTTIFTMIFLKKQKNKKTIVIITFVCLSSCFLVFSPAKTFANETLASRLRGRLLLQVESRGQIWYVNPADDRRYEVNAENALSIFRTLALGITNDDLGKIPTDTNFLNAKIDSDGDGYLDIVEAANGYNLFGPGKAIFAQKITTRLRGRLLLQVQNHGRVWYVNPTDDKKYEVRTATALPLFRQLALGITDADLSKISPATVTVTEVSETSPPGGFGNLPTPPSYTYLPIQNDNAASAGTVMSAAASAIRRGAGTQADIYFTPAVRKAVAYTMDVLDIGGKLLLGNLLSSARLANSGATQATYATAVSFNGQNVIVNFYLQKQPDGSWLLTNL